MLLSTPTPGAREGQRIGGSEEVQLLRTVYCCVPGNGPRLKAVDRPGRLHERKEILLPGHTGM